MDENRTDSEAESRTQGQKKGSDQGVPAPPPATEGHACISSSAQPSASEPGASVKVNGNIKLECAFFHFSVIKMLVLINWGN